MQPLHSGTAWESWSGDGRLGLLHRGLDHVGQSELDQLGGRVLAHLAHFALLQVKVRVGAEDVGYGENPHTLSHRRGGLRPSLLKLVLDG